MRKNVPSTIREVQSSLSWPVVAATHNGDLDIISDPRTKTHTIRIPSDPGRAGEVREIEYLHELGHAYLAERAPVFCAHDFIAQGIHINSVLPNLAGPVRATADWFVDELLYQWVPDEERAEIEEHVEYIRRMIAEGDLGGGRGDQIGGALILAQGIHYLGLHIPLSGQVETYVNTLLSADPSTPTVENFSRLFNALLVPVGLTAAWDSRELAWIVTRK